jgi:hypothetical protein
VALSGPEFLIDSKYPALPAWQWHEGGQTVVWCRHCSRYHMHGLGSFGHRIAHCHADSPYLHSDYVLVDAGDATPDIQADLKFQREGRQWKRRTPAAESYLCLPAASGSVAVAHRNPAT